MSAPDRIWLDWPAANKGEPVFDEPPENEFQAGQVGYVRADIAADLLAALEEANRLLGDIPAAKNNPRVADAIQANRRAMAKARGAA